MGTEPAKPVKKVQKLAEKAVEKRATTNAEVLAWVRGKLSELKEARSQSTGLSKDRQAMATQLSAAQSRNTELEEGLKKAKTLNEQLKADLEAAKQANVALAREAAEYKALLDSFKELMEGTD